jgi:hypothetical protein
MLNLGEVEFGNNSEHPAVAQIQNTMKDARTTFLTHRRKIPPPRATAGPGIAVTLSAERGTVRFAVTAGVFSVTYAPWSSSIFRSLTE